MIPVPYSVAEPFLILAVLLLLLDLFLLSGKGTMTSFRSDVAQFSSMQAVLFIAASYGILTMGFLSDAFFLGEVYSYSSSGLSPAYKLGGPWISGNGSLLFITFLLSLVCLAYRRGVGGPSLTAFRSIAYRVLDIILIVFLALSLLQSPFGEVVPAPPDGVGLSPLLQSSWVLIHPPVIFFGYVLVFFAFALRVSALVTGEREHLRSRWYNGSLLAAWLSLAAGIALGGYWSYVVLGWGGYWAWDPVETASLLPWLALTAYFHIPSPENGKLRDLVLMAAFSLVLYATAVTRGGFLPSLHAFGASPTGYLFLGLAVASVLVFLFLSARDGRPLLMHRETDLRSLPACSLAIAFASFLMLLGVCFIGVTLPVLGGIAGIPFSVGGDFFTIACYPFVLLLAAAFIGCGGSLTRERFAGILVLCLAAGTLCALLRFPMQNALADFGLPLLAVSGGIILLRLVLSPFYNKPSLRFWARSLIHLSLVLILIGVLVSSGGETETISIPVREGSVETVFGNQIMVVDMFVSYGSGEIYYPTHDMIGPEHASLALLARVEDGSRLNEQPLLMSYYPHYGMVSVPTVLSTPWSDLYLSIHPSEGTQEILTAALMGTDVPPGDVILSAKVVPLISLIWAGIVFMIAGMLLVLAGELARPKGINPP